MFELIFLIMGLVALFRKSKLGRIDQNKYSHVPDDKFGHWKSINLKAQNKTMLSVGAYICCAIVIVVFSRSMRLGGIFIIPYLINLVFWVGFQGYYQGKLKKLSRELNIVWP